MGRHTFVLDCSALPNPDAEQLDGLARLCLRLRRTQCELRLATPSAGLRELIDFAGLAGVLAVELERQAEQGEEALGVEEEGELGDPPA
jgi:hypothetical protein